MLAYFSHGKGFRTIAGDGDARRRRAERDWPGAVRAARGAAHRRIARGASLRRRGAVLHARDRFRLLVQHRRDVREVGPPGDPRRLRADDPHHPSRRDRRVRVRRRWRRPASPGVDAIDAGSVSSRRGSSEVPRTDQRRPAPMAGVEVLLHRRLRRASRCTGCARARPAAASVRQAAVEAPANLNFTGGDVFDPILGRTYNEIAGEARSMHKCQGMSQLLPLPARRWRRTDGGPGGVRNYRLRDTVLDGGVARSEREIFDGVDTSLRSLCVRRRRELRRRESRRRGLDRIAATVAEARKALAAGGSSGRGGAAGSRAESGPRSARAR